jgi:hypothetical protein
MVTLLLVWLAAQFVSVALVWCFTIGLGRDVSIGNAPRVVIVVAVKGPDAEFEHFLAGLFAQDYPFYRAIFAVESAEDPAMGLIHAFRAQKPEQVSFVVAGPSQDEGQKTTNLRAALKQIITTDDIVVFADANIRPLRDWLKRLVEPLVADKADIVSGFSWIVTKNRALPSFVLASMSAVLVTIPRLPVFNAAWGGSTAMTRKTCEALDLDQAWRGTLSDDLCLTAVAQKARCSIVAPREILLRSFVAAESFGDIAAEAVRWLILFRVYLPPAYTLAMIGLTFMAGGWLVGLAGVLIQRPDVGEILIAAFVLMLLRTIGRALIVARLWGKAGLAENRLFFVFDPFVAPIAVILSAACGWVALFVRKTTWAGIVYELNGPQNVRILSRRPSN